MLFASFAFKITFESSPPSHSSPPSPKQPESFCSTQAVIQNCLIPNNYEQEKFDEKWATAFLEVCTLSINCLNRTQMTQNTQNYTKK